MHRHTSIDLGYTHEFALTNGHDTIASSRTQAARDLSSRLRCLKKLLDDERDGRLGPCLKMAQRAKARRTSANPRQRGMH